MKKLAILALPLLLAACNSGNGVFTGGSFSATAGGTGAAVEYDHVYTTTTVNGASVKTYTGWILKAPLQPTITFVNHAGSVGASLNTATISIVDQNNNLIDFGNLPDGTHIANPYVQSFPARLIPGWACFTTTNGVETISESTDPNSCTADNREGYERIITYPNEGIPTSGSTIQNNQSHVELISQNIAQALAARAEQDGSTFNAAMIVDFSGTDDVSRPVTLRSERIALNVFQGYDVAGS